jgi:hypothetical protein
LLIVFGYPMGHLFGGYPVTRQAEKHPPDEG